MVLLYPCFLSAGLFAYIRVMHNYSISLAVIILYVDP